jgi:hypothetical protein
MSAVAKATTVKEVLVAARWMIDNVGWCQKNYRIVNDNHVPVSFCALGAIEEVVVNSPDLIFGAKSLLREQLGVKDANPYSYVPSWNDQAGRTKEEVLELYDLAITKI